MAMYFYNYLLTAGSIVADSQFKSSACLNIYIQYTYLKGYSYLALDICSLA